MGVHYENASGGGGNSNFAQGKYEGIGDATPLVITLGFEPQFVEIWDEETPNYFCRIFGTDAANLATIVDYETAAPFWSKDTTYMLSLHATGFTVLDNETEGQRNLNAGGRTMVYVAWG